VIPGKQYKPEDFLAIAWRRRWLILLPALLVFLTVALAAWLLPDRYKSEVAILVVPQRVPKDFVRPTVTTEIDQRLQAISQQILSRTRLERIILDFNLYERERRVGIMEDVIEQMRRDITVTISTTGRNEDSTSFRLGYVARSPRTAMQVTERLASLFIEENIRDREMLAEGTDQFLESQLEEARRQLVEREMKLEQYKRQYMGQLPSQLQSNLQVLQNTQDQVRALSESINRDRDQRAILQRMLADTMAEAPPPPPPMGTPPADGSAPATAEQQLEAARAQVAMLGLRLKPEHPDMIRAQKMLRDLEAKAAQEAASRPLAVGDAGVVTSDPVRQKRINDLRSQIATIDSQIASKQRDQEQLKGAVAAYQARVEATPGRESEMVALSRDYDTLRDRYQQLLSKREDARIAANLERRQIGEQFKIIDAARMPERPESPNRPRILLLGLLGGLAFGLGLAALFEYRDTSMRSDDDVLVAVSLPVLAAVPLLLTAPERHKLRRRKLLVSSAVAALAVVGIAAVLWRLGFLTGRL
jgi:polysaccharide chain length determinant protein (PEP-CTERM system associated)